MKQKIRIHGTEVKVVDGGDSDLDVDVGVASSWGFVGERLGVGRVYSEMTARAGGRRGVPWYDYM